MMMFLWNELSSVRYKSVSNLMLYRRDCKCFQALACLDCVESKVAFEGASAAALMK